MYVCVEYISTRPAIRREPLLGLGSHTRTLGSACPGHHLMWRHLRCSALGSVRLTGCVAGRWWQRQPIAPECGAAMPIGAGTPDRPGKKWDGPTFTPGLSQGRFDSCVANASDCRQQLPFKSAIDSGCNHRGCLQTRKHGQIKSLVF